MARSAHSNQSPDRQSHKRGLLLIDDDRFQARVISCCSQLGMDIVVCRSEQEARAPEIMAWSPTIVVLDQLLTRSELYALARKLRIALGAVVLAVSQDPLRIAASASETVCLLSHEHLLTALEQHAERAVG
jgi:PleD family two-component response regulator